MFHIKEKKPSGLVVYKCISANIDNHADAAMQCVIDEVSEFEDMKFMKIKYDQPESKFGLFDCDYQLLTVAVVSGVIQVRFSGPNLEPFDVRLDHPYSLDMTVAEIKRVLRIGWS